MTLVKLVEQRLRLLQIARVEAFGEPARRPEREAREPLGGKCGRFIQKEQLGV
jgi:hypothetical protein